MRLADALRWGVYDRVLAAASFVVGALIMLGGLLIGAGDMLADVLAGNVFDAAGPDNGAVALVGLLVGFAVWQIGRATARQHTVVTATEEEITQSVSTERIKSEVLVALDGRLSQMEADLEEVRRQAARIEQKERTGGFEFDGVDGTGSSSDAADSATSSSSGTSRDSTVTGRAVETDPGATDADTFDETDDPDHSSEVGDSTDTSLSESDSRGA